MKSNLNIIILNFVTIIFLTSCHTFEHQNIFLQTIKQSHDQKIVAVENNSIKKKSKDIDNKKISNKEQMAPIKVPNQKKKVKTVILNKKISVHPTKNLNLSKIKNWSQKKLVKRMGKSDFIKQEGKLKNYQYHFLNCFLDIFLTKKENGYFVSYTQTRSTNLYGKIETEKCIKEINSKLNKEF